MVPAPRSVDPWSQFVIITPTVSSEGARVTAALVVDSGEAALQAPANNGWSAARTLAGTVSQWNGTATVAGSISQ